MTYDCIILDAFLRFAVFSKIVVNFQPISFFLGVCHFLANFEGSIYLLYISSKLCALRVLRSEVRLIENETPILAGLVFLEATLIKNGYLLCLNCHCDFDSVLFVFLKD